MRLDEYLRHIAIGMAIATAQHELLRFAVRTDAPFIELIYTLLTTLNSTYCIHIHYSSACDYRVNRNEVKFKYVFF